MSEDLLNYLLQKSQWKICKNLDIYTRPLITQIPNIAWAKIKSILREMINAIVTGSPSSITLAEMNE